MQEKMPPFVLRVQGRGLKVVEAKPFADDSVILRIDDLRNPEDWTEITLDLDQLVKWATMGCDDDPRTWEGNLPEWWAKVRVKPS